MFLVDDLVLSPFHGLFWLSNELLNAAQQEFTNEAESITTQLSELYMMLETGQINEEEFDAQEETFLNRLDELQQRPSLAENDEEDDESEGEDEEDDSADDDGDSADDPENDMPEQDELAGLLILSGEDDMDE